MKENNHLLRSEQEYNPDVAIINGGFIRGDKTYPGAFSLSSLLILILNGS